MSVFNRGKRDPAGLGMTSQRARDRLIERLRSEGIADSRVLRAIRDVPRHVYVDEGLETHAYDDRSLPIGLGQTISQPYVVARMTAAVLGDAPLRKVLEIGTGSGYQAAVLASVAEQVYSIERIEALLRQARRRFLQQGLTKIRTRHADGRRGWPEEAPFDAILVTAAADEIEPTLLQQLGPGGVLVAPVGLPGAQTLVRMTRTAEGFARDALDDVVFVPLLGGTL